MKRHVVAVPVPEQHAPSAACQQLVNIPHVEPNFMLRTNFWQVTFGSSKEPAAFFEQLRHRNSRIRLNAKGAEVVSVLYFMKPTN